jgi:oligopeptide transport system ATP-binding protein
VVETGTAREIYKKPQHPYTRGLMACVPRLDGALGDRLVPIEGAPPDLTRLPPGCAFAPRCSVAEPGCLTARPVLEDVGGGHRKACFVAVESEVPVHA